MMEAVRASLPHQPRQLGVEPARGGIARWRFGHRATALEIRSEPPSMPDSRRSHHCRNPLSPLPGFAIVRRNQAAGIANDKLQDMVDSNFKLYKQITDNPDFAEDLLSWMFQRYLRTKRPDRA